MALVGLSLLWMYLYVSRCWAIWQSETKVQARLFYKRYAAPLTLWFAALPITAVIGSVLAPWVRFKIFFASSALVLTASLGLLVYSFQPVIACKLYEFSSHDYDQVGQDE